MVYRSFCKYLYLLGGSYSVFNKVSVFRYRVDMEKCVGCGKCAVVCDMGCNPVQDANDLECIRCGKCGQNCPTGAISSGFCKKRRKEMSDKIYLPQNKNVQAGVRNVMKYLSDITYEKIITGQHTQTMAQEELHYIEEVTGKQPALLGFELLSYSPNINYTDTDEDCMKEVMENYGTLKRAWEWAEKKGLITFTWHWFSPLGGRSKAFFTENTEFDAEKAVTEGTPEYHALLADMDVMAGILRPFCEKQIPILWRPFHEGDGNWFWWGAKGAEPLKKLWRMMYERYTRVHQLNNLIWIWNAPTPEYYPGDDVVDIISRDMYPPAHEHTSQKELYLDLLRVTHASKIALIGEIGTLPSPEAIVKDRAGWASYMTWSLDFGRSETYTTKKVLKEVYDSPYAVTKESLPILY